MRSSHWRAHNHSSYWAYVVHRVSGVLLALFLPVHFWVLSLALQGEATLDGFLKWTEQPQVQLAEAGLVVLLAAHLTGGLRLLAVEFLPWNAWQKTWVALAAGIAVAVGLLFLLSAG
jgi:fumarate reductase subunit D